MTLPNGQFPLAEGQPAEDQGSSGTREGIRKYASFEEFYRCDYPKFVGFMKVLTKNPQTAEDLVQEAFEVAFKRWNEIRYYDSPMAWARRVAIYKLRQWRRDCAKESIAIEKSGLGHADDSAVLPDEHEEVWEVVRLLPERQALVVALFYKDDRSINEIASILRIPPGTVKTTLFWARKSLAIKLGEDFEPWRLR